MFLKNQINFNKNLKLTQFFQTSLMMAHSGTILMINQLNKIQISINLNKRINKKTNLTSNYVQGSILFSSKM